MHRALLVVGVIALAALFPSCGGAREAATTPEGAENRAAERAVLEWLALLDAGDYEESWNRSATVFRTGNGSPEGWANTAAEMRGPLGHVVSRRLKESGPTNLQESAAYAFAYDTAFESRPTSIEEVTVVLDGGFWKVAGYMVR